jgi:cytochrome P450
MAPMVYSSLKVPPRAQADTVLPLSNPIVSTDGKPLHEILVPKRTRIMMSLLHCNRDPDIWGDDAAEWKPERWMNPLPESVARARFPGVYSNL